MEKNFKWKNEQPWTLACTLVLQAMNFPLGSFFGFGPISFPSKMICNRLNHNLIYLNPWSLFKGLYTNLKLLTIRNVWFDWNPLLGPLSKMAFNLLTLSLVHSMFFGTFAKSKLFIPLKKLIKLLPHYIILYLKKCQK